MPTTAPSVTINVGTGEVTARPLTAAEQAAFDARVAEATADLTARQQATADLATTRTAVVGQLAGIAGLSWTALTAAQKQTLIVALLFKVGALDKNLIVQPLASWL